MGELKKVVKKYGHTLIISFNKEESKVYGIKEGDVIKVKLKNGK